LEPATLRRRHHRVSNSKRVPISASAHAVLRFIDESNGTETPLSEDMEDCGIFARRDYGFTPCFAITSAMFAWIRVAAAMSAFPPAVSPLIRLATPRP